MRATLTVTASDDLSGFCKVVLKVWDVPVPEMSLLLRECNQTDGPLRSRTLLDDAVDMVCHPQERSITLVKPAVDIHGLHSRFEGVLGKSLSYRLTALQTSARRLANDGDWTPQREELHGHLVSEFLANLNYAAITANQPPTPSRKDRKPKRSRAAAA